jgi:hypothetical protein
MCNKPEKETSRFWKEALKDVFLVLLGVAVGWGAGWLKDQVDRQSERREAANILLAFVESESRMNKSLIKIFHDDLQGKEPAVPITTPEGLKWQHDPTVPRALVERFTKLEPEIVIEYFNYLRMYEQCGSARDLVVNRTTLDQGRHYVDAGVLSAYVTILGAFEKSADKPREKIARYYGSSLLPQQGGKGH